ncbi:MAG: MmgE/PrpD family protein [Chloroflexi bacterium]|nr:MmgE/PrpD family protein [Chloroflexota bacterium]
MATITESFAAVATEMHFGDLPQVVVSQAKRALLDLAGVAMAGAAMPFPRIVCDYFCRCGGRGEATVVGQRGRVPAVNAALTNGVCSHALDMDDGHRYASGHPGTAIIPAALAAGEMVEGKGRDLLLGIVMGYQVFVRLAAAINPSHLNRGFHTTGTVGPLGAAAAAGAILGLGRKEMAWALGLAGLQGAGLLEIVADGQMAKPLQSGRAASAGLLAALLAQRGAQGPLTVLEGEKGFLRAMTDHVDSAFLNWGNDWEIGRTYIKLYAACRHVHSAIDATRELCRRHSINHQLVDSISVGTYSVADQLTGSIYKPDSVSAAKFSLPFAVALAMVRGGAGVDQFSEESIRDESILRLAQKVTVVVNAEMEKRYPGERGANLEIRTRGGGVYRHTVLLPRGEPENPASDADVEAKFYANARFAGCPEDRARAILGCISALEERNVCQLTELLVWD